MSMMDGADAGTMSAEGRSRERSGSAKSLFFWAVFAVAFLRLYTPLDFVPKAFEDGLPDILAVSGLGFRDYRDYQMAFLAFLFFMNVITIPFALLRGKSSLEELEADDATAAGRIYVSALYLFVWEAYLIAVILIGLLPGVLSIFVRQWKSTLPFLWGVVLVFSLSQATGWGVPVRRSRPKTPQPPAPDVSQTALTRFT
jgi:hypothetical protein